MPGIVTRLLVKEGDPVQPGTPILCIEAMKMENEVKAETSGVVKRLLVGPGKTVPARIYVSALNVDSEISVTVPDRRP